jgi:hypothetical protein
MAGTVGAAGTIALPKEVVLSSGTFAGLLSSFDADLSAFTAETPCKIPDELFKGCAGLAALRLEVVDSGQLTFGSEAFSGCTALDGITWGQTPAAGAVKVFVEPFAFRGCKCDVVAFPSSAFSGVGLIVKVDGYANLTAGGQVDLSGLGGVCWPEGAFRGSTIVNQLWGSVTVGSLKILDADGAVDTTITSDSAKKAYIERAFVGAVLDGPGGLAQSDVMVSRPPPGTDVAWHWVTRRTFEASSGASASDNFPGSETIIRGTKFDATGPASAGTEEVPVTIPANGSNDRWHWHTRRIDRGSAEIRRTTGLGATVQDLSQEVDASVEMVTGLNPSALIHPSEKVRSTAEGRVKATETAFSESVGLQASRRVGVTKRFDPTEVHRSGVVISTQGYQSTTVHASGERLDATSTIMGSIGIARPSSRLAPTVYDATLVMESVLQASQHLQPTQITPSVALEGTASLRESIGPFDPTLDFQPDSAKLQASERLHPTAIFATGLSPTQQQQPTRRVLASEPIDGTELTPAGRRGRSPLTQAFSATVGFSRTSRITDSRTNNLRRTMSFEPTLIDATLVIEASRSYTESNTFTATSTFTATTEFEPSGTLVFPARTRVEHAEARKPLANGAIAGIIIAVVVVVIVAGIITWAVTRPTRSEVPTEVSVFDESDGPEMGAQTDPIDDESLVAGEE